MRYLSKVQVQEAYQTAISEGKKRNRHRNYLIIKTLAESGLRVSELINLTPQNINFREMIFHIKGKGGKIRVVDVSPTVVQLLQMYIINEKIRPKDRIFPLTRDAISKITWKFGGGNPHAFRHTYAINLLRRTGNIRYVQKQLGHSTLAMTEKYLQFHEYQEEKKKLIDLMS